MSKQRLIEKAVLKLNGEFPQGDEGDDWLYQFSSGRYVAGAPGGVNPHAICAREEFNAAADRMRGKPDWSTLPVKAEWLAQDRCGIWKPMQGRRPTIEGGSYWVTDHHLQPQLRGTVIGDWRNTLEKRPERKIEPSPAKPWLEFGEFPPVGTVCEYKFQNPKYSWQPVTVNYISGRHAILTCHLDGDEVHTYGYTAADFRPIKTDKEKFIDAADKAIDDFDKSKFIGNELLSALFDAGFRAPDQK